MPPKTRTIAMLVFLAGFLQACMTTKVLSETCSGAGFAKADPDSLGAILGVPSDRFTESPALEFHTPDRSNPVASIQFKFTPATIALPPGLDETQCGRLDWRTFRATVDRDQWENFLSQPRPQHYEVNFAITDSTAPLNARKMGMALVSIPTGEVLFACGCYGL